MKNKELIGQVNELMKRTYWNARYTSEIRRLHNIATTKQKPGLKRIIAEAIAAKTVNPVHAGSYKRFFSRGSFKPYALFFSALFTPHMEKELTEVLRLVLFSDSSISTGSRKAIELAMKSYQKAIGWNDPEAVQALKAGVLMIETFNYKEAPESAQQELVLALETLVKAEVKTSAEIISIKAYSQLSRMQVHYQGTDLHDLASRAYERACYLI